MEGGAASLTEPGPPPIDDDELAALALAADPDAEVAADAVSLWDLAGWDRGRLLPSWYMPPPMRGSSAPLGKRALIALIVASFLLINAYGLCSTYGVVGFN